MGMKRFEQNAHTCSPGCRGRPALRRSYYSRC